MSDLITAIANNDLKTALALLESGADPNEVAPINLSTPLHQAAFIRNQNLAELLLDAGANPNATNAGGYTPLHLAAGMVTMEMTRSMLDAGADPSIVAKNGKTALDIATEYKAHENVALLKRVLLNDHVKACPSTQDESPQLGPRPKL